MLHVQHEGLHNFAVWRRYLVEVARCYSARTASSIEASEFHPDGSLPECFSKPRATKKIPGEGFKRPRIHVSARNCWSSA